MLRITEFSERKLFGWNWKKNLKKKTSFLPVFLWKNSLLSQPIYLKFSKNKCQRITNSHVLLCRQSCPATHSTTHFLEHQPHALQTTHHCTLTPSPINNGRKHSDEGDTIVNEIIQTKKKRAGEQLRGGDIKNKIDNQWRRGRTMTTTTLPYRRSPSCFHP